MQNIPVKCTRCRHSCMASDWLDVPLKQLNGCTEKVCPRCGCKSYYDCTPQVAWCWSSGLIEIGEAVPADAPGGGGAIKIASGPKYALAARLGVLARHGKGASAGALLVPGVPEADSQKAKGDALEMWLAWCGGRKGRDGIRFEK